MKIFAILNLKIEQLIREDLITVSDLKHFNGSVLDDEELLHYYHYFLLLLLLLLLLLFLYMNSVKILKCKKFA